VKTPWGKPLFEGINKSCSPPRSLRTYVEGEGLEGNWPESQDAATRNNIHQAFYSDLLNHDEQSYRFVNQYNECSMNAMIPIRYTVCPQLHDRWPRTVRATFINYHGVISMHSVHFPGISARGGFYSSATEPGNRLYSPNQSIHKNSSIQTSHPSNKCAGRSFGRRSFNCVRTVYQF
jgi:hypothetical protein